MSMRSRAFITDVASGGTLVVQEEFESELERGEDSLTPLNNYLASLSTLTWIAKHKAHMPRHYDPLLDTKDAVLVSQKRSFPAPKTVHLVDLRTPLIALVRPIPVVLQFGDESVTACSYDLEDFGVGATEFEALSDLKATITDLYFLLKGDAARLGPQPEKQWDFLRSIIRES